MLLPSVVAIWMCLLPLSWGKVDDPERQKFLRKILQRDLKSSDNKGGYCGGGCQTDDDCSAVSVCWKGGTPLCCKEREGSGNRCAPRSCDTAVGVGGGLCFSGETMVHVMDGGTIPMKELQVGDPVLTRTGTYQPVYAFAHWDPTRSAQFLQIYTRTLNGDDKHNNLENSRATSPLEVTKDHLVYIHGMAKPIPAAAVQVGDVLQGVSTATVSNQSAVSKHQPELVVTKIQSVTRKGLYNPLTQDGTIVVSSNGIVASNYIAVQRPQTPDGYVQLSGIGTIHWLHQADLIHMWMSPLRIVCGQRGRLCHNHGSERLHPHVSWGLWLVHVMENKSLLAQLLVLVSAMLAFGMFVVVEYLLWVASSCTSCVSLLFALGIIVAVARLLEPGVVVHIQKKTTKVH